MNNQGFGPRQEALSPAVTEKVAAELLGMSIKTLQARRYLGKPPVYLKLGRAIRYRISDLEAYMAAGAVEPMNK